MSWSSQDLDSDKQTQSWIYGTKRCLVGVSDLKHLEDLEGFTRTSNHSDRETVPFTWSFLLIDVEKGRRFDSDGENVAKWTHDPRWSSIEEKENHVPLIIYKNPKNQKHAKHDMILFQPRTIHVEKNTLSWSYKFPSTKTSNFSSLKFSNTWVFYLENLKAELIISKDPATIDHVLSLLSVIHIIPYSQFSHGPHLTTTQHATSLQ